MSSSREYPTTMNASILSTIPHTEAALATTRTQQHVICSNLKSAATTTNNTSNKSNDNTFNSNCNKLDYRKRKRMSSGNDDEDEDDSSSIPSPPRATRQQTTKQRRQLSPIFNIVVKKASTNVIKTNFSNRKKILKSTIVEHDKESPDFDLNFDNVSGNHYSDDDNGGRISADDRVEDVDGVDIDNVEGQFKSDDEHRVDSESSERKLQEKQVDEDHLKFIDNIKDNTNENGMMLVESYELQSFSGDHIRNNKDGREEAEKLKEDGDYNDIENVNDNVDDEDNYDLNDNETISVNEEFDATVANTDDKDAEKRQNNEIDDEYEEEDNEYDDNDADDVDGVNPGDATDNYKKLTNIAPPVPLKYFTYTTTTVKTKNEKTLTQIATSTSNNDDIPVNATNQHEDIGDDEKYKFENSTAKDLPATVVDIRNDAETETTIEQLRIIDNIVNLENKCTSDSDEVDDACSSNHVRRAKDITKNHNVNYEYQNGCESKSSFCSNIVTTKSNNTSNIAYNDFYDDIRQRLNATANASSYIDGNDEEAVACECEAGEGNGNGGNSSSSVSNHVLYKTLETDFDRTEFFNNNNTNSTVTTPTTNNNNNNNNSNGCATKNKTTKIPNNMTTMETKMKLEKETQSETQTHINTNIEGNITLNNCESLSGRYDNLSVYDNHRTAEEAVTAASVAEEAAAKHKKSALEWVHDDGFKYNNDKHNLNYGDRDSNEAHLRFNVIKSDEPTILQHQDQREVPCFKIHHQQQETICNPSNNIAVAVNKQESESQQHQHHINQFLSPLPTHEQLKNEVAAANRDNDNYHHMHHHQQQQEHLKTGLNSYVQEELEQQYQHQQHQQQQQHHHEQRHHQAYENLLQNLAVPEEKQNHQLHHHSNVTVRQQQQQRSAALHHEIQHYAHEQLFHLQHQQQEQQHGHQQSQTSLHPMSLHSHQMHSQLQLQHTIHQHQHRLLQRENEHTHLISYLHDTTVEQQQQNHNRLHQQQQQTHGIYHYHQQQQHEYQQQHLQQPASLLMPSQRQQQQLQQQLMKNGAGVATAMTSSSASKQCITQLTTGTPTTMDDLMVDEFHEDPSTAYKLGLSPSNVKHENQDDGYETSAGDVLTPNSHSSSTHSVTPQHQMQHTTVGFIQPTKNEDQQQLRLQPQSQQQQLAVVNVEVLHLQQQQHINDNINQENSSDTNTNIQPRDPYGFMDDEVAAAADNMRMMASPAAHEIGNNVSNNYLDPTETGAVNNSQVEKMFPIQRQQQQQQRQQQIHNSTIPTATDSASQHNFTQELTSGNIHNKIVCNTIPDDEQQTFSDINDTSIIMNKAPQKRRGRKKKLVAKVVNVEPNNPNAPPHDDAAAVTGSGILLKSKERKKHDRFNGMSEEEVVKRTLPDHLCDNLDIVIIGINPGLFAAYKGHHYAGPGNHFWKCLYLSGLTQDQMSADEDYKLMKYGIGFTNMVQRATKGSADLTRKEIKEGSRILLKKLQRFRPKIAVFNGKLIFEVFSGKKDFNFGRQRECVDGTDTYVWVMPSSSARCAQLPRAADKIPFYAALKKFRDYLNGSIPHIDDFECVFTEQKIKKCCEQESLKLSLSSSRGGTLAEQSSILYNSGNRSGDTSNSNLPPPPSSQQHDDLSPVQNNSNILTQFPSEPNSSYIYASGENHNNRNVAANTPRPGPPQTIMGADALTQHNSGCGDNYMITTSSFHGEQHPPEKKKRGRPKKIKGHDILDSTISNKMLINSHNSQGEAGAAGSTGFSNILNLSLMGSVGGELPKKKRGRPKKIKAPLDMLQTQSAMPPHMHQKPNAMSIQTLTGEHIASPQRQQPQLYGTPPPSISVQQRLYTTSASPMRSPALNCSYAANTPPNTGSQPTPPINQQQLSDKLSDSNGAMGSPADLISSQQGTASQMCGGDTSSSNYFTGKLMSSATDIISNETVIATAEDVTEDTEANGPHLGESPAPSSPNICAVDFEPPTAIVSTNATNNAEHEQHHRQMSLLHQRMQQQRSRYANTAQDAVSNEHTGRNSFQQWLSPQHSQHFNHPHNQPQQQHHQTLHYQEQQMQLLQLKHNQEQQQSLHSQWHRHHHHRYEDASNYLLSAHHHQQLQPQPHTPNVSNQQQASNFHSQLSSDVASKSLSGLESLVDQIPTISENESSASAMSSIGTASETAVIESRLQCLQRNGVANATELDNSENYCSSAAAGSTPSDHISETNETVTGANSNSGSNTPHATNSLYGANSPGNYSVHHLNSATGSAASSPGIMSPHRHQQQHSLHQQQYGNAGTTTRLMVDMLPPSTSTNSPSDSVTTVAAIEQTISCTPPTSTTAVASSNASSNSSNLYPSSISNIHNSNFSVSNLAASSAASSANSENNNYATLTPKNTQSVYRHSSLMAAAALAAAANSPTNLVTAETSTTADAAAAAHAHHVTQHPQMYMDLHAHMPPHVPVNPMYPPPPHHHHNDTAHHHHHAAAAYAVTQHSVPPSEYSNLYSTASASAAVAAAASQTATAAAAASHTLHMPSPNYPYCYGTQGNYATAAAMHAAAAHQSTVTPPPPGVVSAAAAAAAVVYHTHPHHGHHPHHLAMFDRLKPSDIGGYGGF